MKQYNMFYELREQTVVRDLASLTLRAEGDVIDILTLQGNLAFFGLCLGQQSARQRVATSCTSRRTVNFNHTRPAVSHAFHCHRPRNFASDHLT